MRTWVRGPLAALAAASLAVIGMLSVPPGASAEDNGLGLKPLMGWSSWSFVRGNPTAARIEAQADAMKSSGLVDAGYRYVNVDDFWYRCPGSQGPDVDQYGRWVTDAAKFPAGPGGENGVQVVADHVHGLGLKFGLYVTPGISRQAVAQNTAIEGTPYHADDIATTTAEKNYNCGGMVGIDYSKPGAQEFIASWAKQFASWGVDYVKIDGVGTPDVPDVTAWSDALRRTGRPIHLELSNSLSLSAAHTWQSYANGWRTGGDIECYCGPNGASYPLTDWSHISSRFDQAAAWQPYGGPGGFNDYDSIEVGNGANDGLTPDERMTQMSLWALAASPFVLGTDLTHLDPADLAMLKNADVVAADQDAVDASRISRTGSSQTFAKTEPNGDVVVGLFNTGGTPQVLSTSAAALGLPAGTDYALRDLWTHRTTETTGAIAPEVAPHGVALYRVSPLDNPTQAPPDASFSGTGPAALTGGTPVTFTESFTDNGDLAAQRVDLSLRAPAGWTVTATSPTSFPAVETGQRVQATFQVTAPAPGSLFQQDTLTAEAAYTWSGRTAQTLSAGLPVTTSPPVGAPYLTYSSATDAPAVFAQSGSRFGVSGAGGDLWTGSDAYSSVYLPHAVGTSSTVDTEVASWQDMSGYAKAGIIVRNDMTGSGTSPEGVLLFASPSGGIQLEWAGSGGTNIDSVTPANGSITATLPVHLKLERTGATTYTGYYSSDGNGWYEVGTATVPAQADLQDAGLFVTSHATGSPGTAVFDGFGVTAGATPPPPGPTPYEAESPANTVAGGARIADCSACSGGKKVGYVGAGGTLTFNGVTVAKPGTYDVTIAYLDGEGRQADVSVDGATPTTVRFAPTGGFDTVGTMTVALPLAAGSNTIEFADPAAYAPDFDRIFVAANPD